MTKNSLEMCKKLKTNPVPFIIGIAVSSKLQVSVFSAKKAIPSRTQTSSKSVFPLHLQQLSLHISTCGFFTEFNIICFKKWVEKLSTRFTFFVFCDTI